MILMWIFCSEYISIMSIFFQQNLKQKAYGWAMLESTEIESVNNLHAFDSIHRSKLECEYICNNNNKTQIGYVISK